MRIVAPEHAAALRLYSIDDAIGLARRLDPGLEDRDFADAARRLDRWGDAIFAPFGLSGGFYYARASVTF